MVAKKTIRSGKLKIKLPLEKRVSNFLKSKEINFQLHILVKFDFYKEKINK